MHAATLSPAPTHNDDPFAERRATMVASQLRTNEIIEPTLVRALIDTPREAFLPPALAASAYIDRALPLGGGRALNPPLTSARLLAELHLVPGQHLLLIGAATGYAAAIAAALGVQVTAVEEDGALVAHATTAMAAIAGVTLVTAPLSSGAPEHGPFDAMMIDGAVEVLPETLTAQLKPGARITCGLADRGVSRLARCVAVAGSAALRPVPFVDLECVPLPGFAVARGFSF